jgi:membrane associated rhomboid family serine protease
VQANVGSHCLECAKATRPSVSTRAKYWHARQPTLVTYVLIGLNVAVFAYLGILDPETLAGRTIRPDQGPWVLNGPWVKDGDWQRIVSSGFLHFGIIHLAFNMLLLFQLGSLLERELGRVRFGLLYLASLLGGSAGVLLLSPNELTGGASGAVFGLLGAAFIGLRQRGVNVWSTGIGTVLVLNLFITFSSRGEISLGGHLGGLVAGGLAGWVTFAPPWKGVPRWAGLAAPLGVAALSLLVCWLALAGVDAVPYPFLPR